METKALRELQTVKSLLVVLLLKLGATPEEVSFALGVHPSRISQMVPVRKIRPIRALSGGPVK